MNSRIETCRLEASSGSPYQIWCLIHRRPIPPSPDSTVAFIFSVAAPPALTPPGPSLFPRERGEKDQESFFFIPSSPPGRGGVGEVRAGGAATLDPKATAENRNHPSAALLDGPAGEAVHQRRRQQL